MGGVLAIAAKRKSPYRLSPGKGATSATRPRVTSAFAQSTRWSREAALSRDAWADMPLEIVYWSTKRTDVADHVDADQECHGKVQKPQGNTFCHFAWGVV